MEQKLIINMLGVLEIFTWSFCQDKIMTTGGEGGMIMTKDEELYNKMWSLKDHGKTKSY